VNEQYIDSIMHGAKTKIKKEALKVDLELEIRTQLKHVTT